MKNVEKADRVHLGKLIDSLQKGHYVIPDFQRDFEWKPWDVRELIRSIFMDYYIGTLLLWKGSKENFTVLNCEPIYGFTVKQDPRQIVLDGQQRLTAMHYAFFAPEKPFPKRSNTVVFLINIIDLINENYEDFIRYEFVTKKIKSLLSDKEQLFATHTFPLGELQHGTWGTSDWIKEYRDYWQIQLENEEDEEKQLEYKGYIDGARHFKQIIKELLDEFNMSYIELDRNIDVAKVCDIFTQINSRGVRLDIFDLLNAILRPKEIYLKDMWRKAESRLSFLSGSDKVKNYILQVMSILEQSYCSSKYLYYLVPESKKTIRHPDGSKEEIILIESTDEFNERWSQSVDALENTIKHIQNPRDYGAIKYSFIPYPSIIPAFASIKEYVRMTNPPNMINVNQKIKKWYWASVYTNRYSSSVESTTAKDFMALKKWFENDDLKPDMINEFESDFRKLEFKNDNFKGSAIYNAIFNMFIINGAKDWNTFAFPEYGELDDHHIVPYSEFREIAGKSINSILNKSPLSAITNRHIINKKMPNVYIQEMIDNNSKEDVLKVMATHLISEKAVSILLRTPFEKSDYEEFLDERRKSIIDAIESKILNERFDFDKSQSEYFEEIGTIEKELRKLVVNKLGNSLQEYENTVPSLIKEQLEEHITRVLRQKPYLSINDFNSYNSRIKETTMSQLQNIILKNSNWAKFEDTFKNKSMLLTKFNQLRPFRNEVGHFKESDSVQNLEGRAAIEWFNKILRL